MKYIKAGDLIDIFFSSMIEAVACIGLVWLFAGSVPVPLIILMPLVIFLWHLLSYSVEKPKDIPKVGYVIVNVDDPDKELLAIKLLVGEADLINKEEIAFDVVKES